MALPQVIPLFGVPLSGLVVAAALALGVGLAVGAGLGRRDPETRAAAAAAAVPLLCGALLGARLGNQLLSPDLRPGDPASWFLLTATSVSFTGALCGAAGGAALALRGLPAARRWAALDLLAAAAAGAVAVGWLGLPAATSLAGLPVSDLAAAGFAALAALLWWQWPRRDYPGQNAATFVVLASALRFALGFDFGAAPLLGPWSLTQLGDAGAGLGGLALTAWLSARGAGLR